MGNCGMGWSLGGVVWLGLFDVGVEEGMWWGTGYEEIYGSVETGVRMGLELKGKLCSLKRT